MLKKNWFIFLLFPIFCISQNAEMDSLKFVLKNAKHDTLRCKILEQLIDISDEDESQQYNKRLKLLSEKNLVGNNNQSQITFYKTYLAISLATIGRECSYKSNWLTAIDYYKKSLLVSTDNKDTVNTIMTLNDIGFVYEKTGNIIEALNYYQQGLKLSEQIKDKEGTGVFLNAIAQVYALESDDKEALTYNEKSLKINEEINDKNGIAYSFNNIGMNYMSLKDTATSLIYLRKALQLNREINNKQGIAQVLNNIGNIYNRRKEFDKSFIYLQESLQLKEEIGDKKGIVYSLINLAEIYREKKNYNEALSYLKRALQISEETGIPQNIGNAARNLKVIYKLQGNYKEALEMLELCEVMRDSILNKETQKASIKSQFKYEFDKKEIELKAEAKIEQQKSEAQIKFQKLVLYAIAVCIVLLIVIAFFIFKNYNQKKEAATSNAIQKAEEKERARLAQDLHDDLGGTLSALKLNLTANPNLTSGLEVLDKAIDDLRSISHKLMPINFESAGLQKSLHHYIEHIKHPQIEFVFSVNEALIKTETQLTIYRITLELLTNVVKHAQAKNCTLQCIIFPNFIRIFMEDDGIGFNINESKTGIGLKNIQNRVQQIKGKMQLQSNANGTTVTIEIPV